MYTPSLVKGRPWEDVVEFYADFAAKNPQFEPMYTFVSQITASDYGKSLFPATSHATLFISQVPMFEWKCQVLEIDFDHTRQQFHFEYWGHRTVEKRWTKDCDAAEGFFTFERFLKHRKWFG